jgi:hypothetical protein
MQFATYLLARFSEPSSYAGLGAALALLGWNVSDPTLSQIIQCSAALCGLLALFLKDRGLAKMVVLAIVTAPLLTACGGLIAAGSAAGAASGILAVVNEVANTVDTTVQTACADYETGRAAANAVVAIGLVPAKIVAKITAIESFGDAACANPPSGDPLSTAVWLGKLVGQITTLTSDLTASAAN